MLYGAMNFPIRPVLDEIQAIGSLGLDYFELAMDPPEAHYLRLREQRDAIHQALAHYGMALICHLPTFIHTADLTKSIREASLAELMNSFAVADHLGARKVVMHPSFVGGMGRNVPELSRQYAIECLDAMVRLAEKSDCRLCLENLFARLTPFTTPDDFETVLDRWPYLAMTLDVGHAFIDGRGMDRIFEFLNRFGNRIHHIHISDNFGQRDDHLTVGDGAIDFKALIDALKQIQYDDTMTLEIFTEDRTDLIRSRNALQRIMDSDESLWPST
jgi:sugar phosphate isomerase/epimerase